jgi:hypothetical protein
MRHAEVIRAKEKQNAQACIDERAGGRSAPWSPRAGEHACDAQAKRHVHPDQGSRQGGLVHGKCEQGCAALSFTVGGVLGESCGPGPEEPRAPH